MLVLTRKITQSILIGDDIRITLVRVGGSAGNPHVALGIQAPGEIRVDREEVRRRIEMEGPQPAKQ